MLSVVFQLHTKENWSLEYLEKGATKTMLPDLYENEVCEYEDGSRVVFLFNILRTVQYVLDFWMRFQYSWGTVIEWIQWWHWHVRWRTIEVFLLFILYCWHINLSLYWIIVILDKLWSIWQFLSYIQLRKVWMNCSI